MANPIAKKADFLPCPLSEIYRKKTGADRGTLPGVLLIVIAILGGGTPGTFLNSNNAIIV